MSEEERIRKLEELVSDELACILGWAWKFNELAGHDIYDENTPVMDAFYEFHSRAKVLGVPL